MDEKIATLEKEYCPPLDAALFYAIVTDYDVANELQLVAAREVLDDLRSAAEVESATGFDECGTGSTRGVLDSGASRTHTDVTDVTDSVASLGLDGATSVSSTGVPEGHHGNFEDLQLDQKYAVLAEAFPEQDLSTITEVLDECGFNVEKSIDELLTRLFLQANEESGSAAVVPKGIDGFIRTDEWQGRGGKRKKRRRANQDSRSGSDQASSEASQLVPQYTKPKLDAEESGSATFTAVKSAREGSAARSTNGGLSAATAASYNAAKQEAYAKAAAAARRSRSDPLMGGAASYYASVGRDAKVAADRYAAKAADELAERQSTKDSADLHGLDVKNAVRIALEKVQGWWDNGASEWARQGKAMGDQGFSVVTGLGRHSEGGKAKIGPAVRKALVEHGWRVHESGGIIWVNGRARG